MKFVPNAVSRFGHRSALKIKANSPTILVVSGVVGLGASAVLAAVATRKIDPVLDQHKQARAEIGYISDKQSREHQASLVRLYLHTGTELGKIYAPTIIVASCSTVAVLGGHKMLRTRHAATLAAYSALGEQFNAYRRRIARTLGVEMEEKIFRGAHGEYEEDPNHPGEYRLKAKYDEEANVDTSYLRPWFDETNYNFTRQPEWNYLFLKGVQHHMNNLLATRGHLFLNEVLDALQMPRVPEGAVAGWVYDSPKGDGFVDFGFMSGDDPQTVAFRNKVDPRVQLNFNIDTDTIWQLI